MRRVTIAVIGNAKTTRANVEALISDVVSSVDEATLALVHRGSPSDGQVWIEQYATDNNIPLKKYVNNDYDKIIKDFDPKDLKFFMLWDENDQDCQLAAFTAASARIPAYDLTDGLMMLPLGFEKPVQVEIPEAEATVSDEPVEPQLSSPRRESAPESEEEDYDDDEVEYELGELLTLALEEAGKVLARSFAKEFLKLFEK